MPSDPFPYMGIEMRTFPHLFCSRRNFLTVKAAAKLATGNSTRFDLRLRLTPSNQTALGAHRVVRFLGTKDSRFSEFVIW
jgi:hypothetical protein